MDGKDVIIGQLLEENRHLKQEIAQLKEKIAQLEKDSSTSSKPPSSDIVKPAGMRRRRGTKRRRGGQPGHRKFSRPPFTPQQVDKVIEYTLSKKQAQGLEPLNEWQVIQQVELPQKMFRVIEHRARKYRDPATGRITIAPLPATVRKGGLAGPKLTALLAFLKSGCHCSFSTMQRYCREVLGLTISRGMLSKVIQKTAQALQQPYEHLRARLPQEPALGIDETGHHDNGKLHWTWCLQTPRYSVFHIDRSRGSKVLRKLLGRHYQGIVNCDYYSSYLKFARLFRVRMQYCLAHLIRELRFVAKQTLRKVARWAHILLKLLRKMFQYLHRRDSTTPATLRAGLARLREEFLRWVRRPPDHRLARKLERRFRAARAEHYFRFIDEPGIEPTNNATERALRRVVIDRKVTQGTCGHAGMRWCERSWTAVATCIKQNRNVLNYLHQALRAHWLCQPAPKLV